jgi:hypothetical protein
MRRDQSYRPALLAGIPSLLSFLLSALLPGMAWGGSPWIPVDAEPRERAIWEALEQPTQVDFFDTELENAMAYLEGIHDIEIV